MLEDILFKSPHNGFVDPHGEVRLRIGIVDNPTIYRKEGELLNPLNPIDIINMKNGKICIRWISEQGGLIRPPEFKDEKKYEKRVNEHGEVVLNNSSDENGKIIKNAANDEMYDDASNREMVTLTHPMLWANDKRWCGMHYLPPVGSIVIVGFRKHNLPILLGFLQSNYSICPPISLGELMMKGYGQNQIWWKQSDEIEMKAWAIKDQVDLEDPKTPKKNTMSSKVFLVIKANDARKSGSPEGTDKYNRYVKIYAEETKEGHKKSTLAVFSASKTEIIVKDHITTEVTSCTQTPKDIITIAEDPRVSKKTTRTQNPTQIHEIATVPGKFSDQTITATDIVLQSNAGGSTTTETITPTSITIDTKTFTVTAPSGIFLN